jgi:4-oxalocrotonate tautomerase
MPLVEIKILTGRTPQQKQQMVEQVTQAIATTIDVPLEKVKIHIVEMPPEHYAVGGKLIQPVVE